MSQHDSKNFPAPQALEERLQRMELRFPALRVVNPETLVKELSP